MKNKGLFSPIYPLEKLNPEFVEILNSIAFFPAKRELLETFFMHPNLEKHFIEQFQTTGFNARIWELYLLAFFMNSGYGVNCDSPNPDFFILKGEMEVAVEAVTSNPGEFSLIDKEDIAEIFEYIAFKLGSPLYSKLQKKYWNLPNIIGFPLVFAIAPFHSKKSLKNSDAALLRYLYGIEISWHYDQSENLITNYSIIKEHKHRDRIKSSGFFNQAGAENVSAILFSNAGTISKFNRIGYQKNKIESLTMYRYGMNYNHEKNASKPDFFLIK